ncbi:TGACG-sequence-specific DNA-binding protein TGA-1A-like isoform X1 [Andrographis paniculata]|uniref:TGACG-sequence-specific DNA-binding protein TGA-1A-like isoform X1 n=1 Tax=Andrographis paniculata TaxID=175694 RepID=UPI0021E7AD2E|nr:TGACG-sequence-specific DNA-binding protein TGA-1A-like isoform X1 [Andrographis paniculata]
MFSFGKQELIVNHASSNRMNSASTQFVPSRRMGICEPIHQMAMWGDFKGNDLLPVSPPMILDFEAKLDNQSEDTSHQTAGPSNIYTEQASKLNDKALRRLAQNREAARKSRMRKKAYVQQLENSKLKLIQLEQELDRARKQGRYVDSSADTTQLSHSGSMNPGILKFEMEYSSWLDEQNRRISDLRKAVHSNIGEREMQILVDAAIKHYSHLFTMKAAAAKADVFYIMSGMWKTPAERFFFWIGGFRPSETIKILLPHLEPLLEQQHLDISNLGQSCHQAEDALSQGMDKLQHIIGGTLADGQLGEGNYFSQINAAKDKLEDLVRFVCQADYLRQETLQQIYRILTTYQTAQALLAMGEYSQRLRTLSSCWSSRSHERA